MKEQDESLKPYFRDIQSMVPPGRDNTGKAVRRERMVRLLRQRLQTERNRGNLGARV